MKDSFRKEALQHPLTARATIVRLVVPKFHLEGGRVQSSHWAAGDVRAGHLTGHYTLGGTAGSRRGPAVTCPWQ